MTDSPDSNSISPALSQTVAPQPSRTPRRSGQLPNQRWQISTPQPEQADRLAQTTRLSPLLTQVLINRGIDTPEAAENFLNPEGLLLPSPIEEFPDLAIALELLMRAIATRQRIAICGDYDADGMTSTALLLRALRFLGADVDYAIPSRMQEGYGINQRIVEEFYDEGVQLILTVDNGIAAFDPIARARELGLTVIVTDHHDIPEILPPANAILNPKLIREDSPYRGVAGVGVAYILAVCLAQCLRKTQDLTTPLIELFTLGTIADLAPLTGVNRRWVRRGLKLLPKSKLAGVQALIQVAGLGQEKALKPEAIGFRLGPRINAIGRISDPQIVIELLTTDDDGRALELAMQCEQVNQQRQQLCEAIEQEAIAWCEHQQFDVQQDRVLVVVQPEWHHGVIGIVASRLVERYGVPVFIGTYEGEDQAHIRGSARGIPEFNVFEALQFGGELLEKFGGHKAAGGFSLKAENLEEWRSRLQLYANGQLQPEHLKPIVAVDVEARFNQLTFELVQQIDAIHPCGIENPDPVFWTPNVRIVEQKAIGRDQAHLKLTLAKDGELTTIKAIAWRWGEYCPLPNRLDVAYRLRVNEWNGQKSVELEVAGVRPSSAPMAASAPDLATQITEPFLPASAPNLSPKRSTASGFQPQIDAKTLDPYATPIAIGASQRSGTISGPAWRSAPSAEIPLPLAQAPMRRSPNSPFFHISDLNASSDEDEQDFLDADGEFDDLDADAQQASARVEFYFNKRRYTCSILKNEDVKELRIRNTEGQVLTLQPRQKRGLLGRDRAQAKDVDVSQPHYFNLIRAALNALEITEKTQLIQEKDQLIVEKNQQIETLQQQLELLQQELSQLSSEQQDQFQRLETNLRSREQAIQQHEAHIAQLQSQLSQGVRQLNLEHIRRQVKTRLGESVWHCIHQYSQKDLYVAYKNYELIRSEGFTAQVADYSEAGLRLSFAVEREIIHPFFKTLHQYLLVNGGSDEIGGVNLGPRKKYTLGMLPPLISAQWYSFKDDVLKRSYHQPSDDLYYMASANYQVNQSDRTLIKKFLEEWQHPLASWLRDKETSAASAIDQINKLRNIAAHAENSLFEWQFELLDSLILGGTGKGGVFREIYSA